MFVSPRLVAVADGVGGAAAGELASSLTIQKMIGLDKRRLSNTLEEEFAAAVADANDVIKFATQCDPGYMGMATTLTAVAISNDGTYLVANIGDSRTYLFRNDQLQQLTRDDSLVQELVDKGAIAADDARQHPQRNVVLDALDGGDRISLALQAVLAQNGDRLLLCSDGVSDYLTDRQIADCLRISDPTKAVQRLLDAALDHGSRDNVSAVVADTITRQEPDAGWLDSLPAARSTDQ